MGHNSVILLKTILVIAMSSLTFFAVGFGFSIKAKGGIIGQDNFVGLNYKDHIVIDDNLFKEEDKD